MSKMSLWRVLLLQIHYHHGNLFVFKQSTGNDLEKKRHKKEAAHNI